MRSRAGMVLERPIMKSFGLSKDDVITTLKCLKCCICLEWIENENQMGNCNWLILTDYVCLCVSLILRLYTADMMSINRQHFDWKKTYLYLSLGSRFCLLSLQLLLAVFLPSLDIFCCWWGRWLSVVGLVTMRNENIWQQTHRVKHVRFWKLTWFFCNLYLDLCFYGKLVFPS